MKMTKGKIAVLALLALTIVHVVAFYQSYIAYQIWAQEQLQEYPEHIRPYADFIFQWTKTFDNFVLAGFGLLFLWLLMFACHHESKLKPELTTLEARHRLGPSEGQKENKKR